MAINSVIYSRLGFFCNCVWNLCSTGRFLPCDTVSPDVLHRQPTWLSSSSLTNVASRPLKQHRHRRQIRCVSIYLEIAQTGIAIENTSKGNTYLQHPCIMQWLKKKTRFGGSNIITWWKSSVGSATIFFSLLASVASGFCAASSSSLAPARTSADGSLFSFTSS